MYEVKVEESSKIYEGLFLYQHKNDMVYKKKWEIYLKGSMFVWMMFVLAECYELGEFIFESQIILFARILFIFLLGSLVLSIIVQTDIKKRYRLYWSVRKILYKKGTYISKILFLPNEIQLKGYEKGSENMVYIPLKQIKNILICKRGIILKIQEDENYIYISSNQFNNIKDFQTVINWLNKR